MKWHSRFLLAAAIAAVAGNSLAQSVADVARRERARQSSAQSKVVITGTSSAPATDSTTPSANSDVTPSATAAPASGAATTPTAGNPAETAPPERGEQYWRSAFQRAREELSRAESAAQIMDLRVKQLNTEFLRAGEIYNREYRLGPEIAAAQKQLDEARNQADAARKKIADLEEQLRRSGGPAGWAR